MYYESDHSDEEEAWCDPDSECAPLIDLWYDVHSSFPKIPGDYVSPPPSHVWLALSWQNLNTSWALVSSSIYDLVIRQGISLLVPIHFEFGSSTARVGRSGSIASYLIRASWVYFCESVF